MIITKSHLKKIIKEEISKITEEEDEGWGTEEDDRREREHFLGPYEGTRRKKHWIKTYTPQEALDRARHLEAKIDAAPSQTDPLGDASAVGSGGPIEDWRAEMDYQEDRYYELGGEEEKGLAGSSKEDTQRAYEENPEFFN